MNWNDIPGDQPTPSLVVSAEVARNNIRSMQEYCNQKNLALRPHTKTHKSIRLAKEQIAAGAVGLTVAKAGEAEVMSHASDDIMIAYPAVGPSRLRRVTELAKTVKLRIGIDSQAAAEILQSASSSAGVKLGIMVDIEVGFHRTGVVEASKAIELCKFVDGQSHLRFEGLMCFPGHILWTSELQQWSEYNASLQQVVEGLARKGIEAKTISGGSTPTAKSSHLNPFLNEIRPGTYVYNDLNEVRLGVCGWEDCAARVLATVVSTPERNKFIVDAGSKALSSDRNAVNPDAGFGYLVDYPDAQVTRLSEEHGEIVVPMNKLDSVVLPKVGDRVWIIPNHICVCVNLQNRFYLMEANELLTLPVDARGMLE
jgi:D-serine deaminase-like pyridoxal phosphate-dependent protein